MGKKLIFLAVLRKNERGKTKKYTLHFKVQYNIYSLYTNFTHSGGVSQSIWKINIMQEVVPQYKQLGNILLQDPDGVRVMAIEMNHHHVDDVVYEVLQKWLLENVDATWDKLVQCLEDVNLGPLAVKINSCLSETG